MKSKQENTNQNGFISLREATFLCNHSQEYLSLLVRKQKLKAVKIGRNWVTKKEWIEEYLNISCEAREGLRDLDESFNTTVVDGSTSSQEERFPRQFGLYVTRRLILGFLGSAAFLFLAFGGVKFHLVNVSNFVSNFGGLYASNGTTLSSIESGISLQFIPISGLGELSAVNSELSRAISGKARGYFGIAMNSLRVTQKNIFSFADYLVNGKTEVVSTGDFTEVHQAVLEEDVNSLEKDISDYSKSKFDDFRSGLGLAGEDVAVGQTQGNGVIGAVVVPSKGDLEVEKEKMRNSFSDEVTVKPTEAGSGVLIPSFKDKPGDEYLYLMVPVNSDK